MDRDRQKGKGCGCLWQTVVALLFLLFLISSSTVGPIGPGIKHPRQSAAVQTAHSLGLALYSYANDHDGVYPNGASSTEAFQQLIDGGYVTDPAIFYVPMPGKTRAIAGQKLKPENVGFDLTGGADLKDSDELPLVFITGYRVNYAAGGSAVPVNPAGPVFEVETRTWPFPWPTKRTTKPMDGLAVYYKGNWAMWISAQGSSGMNGRSYSLQHFIPNDFDAKGKTYRQLTPEGVLR